MQPFLNEKFTPAALPEVCAPRREVTRRFERAAEGRFVYVGAPAGSGKTVSALQWLAAYRRKSVWISLDAYDNVPSVFYKLFASGILSAQSGNKNMRRILFSPDFSASPVEYTVRLLSEWLPDDEQYVLVLDDFHLITGVEIHKSLPAALKRLPFSFIVVILSRNVLSRAETGESLMTEYIKLIPDVEAGIIDAKHLEFTSDETAEYFSSLGKKISREEAEIAWKATGGWPLGINTLAQSGRFEAGKTGYIFTEYIREHLWNAWEPDLRDFMLKTSITDEISLELAAALTGRRDCGELLQKLCAENAFISRLGNGAYRYHHLFLEFLREMTRAQSAAGTGIDLAGLNRIAALYYLEQGRLIARRYAVRSGDQQVIMQAMYRFISYSNPSLTEYVEFSKAFNRDALPEAICETFPFLYVSHMFTSYLSGNADEASYYMDKLYTHLETITGKFPRFLEVIINMLVLDHRFPISFQIERLMSMPPVVGKAERQQGASLIMQLPFVHRSTRDYSELVVPEMMEKYINAFGPFLHEHRQVARSTLTSGLLLEQNRVSEALNHAREAVWEAEETQSQEFIFAARMHLAAVQFALNSRRDAQTTLAAAKKHISEGGAQYLNHNFLAFQTLIQLWDNNVPAAKEWLAQYFVTDYERLPLYKVFQQFTTARAWMVLNETEKAMRCIEQLEKFSGDFRRHLDKSEAGVLRAALEWALGRRREAAATLEGALRFCGQWGFIRVIANEGAAIEPVLKRIAAKTAADGIDPAFVTRVLLAAHETAQIRPGIAVNIKRRGKPVKLSGQQRRMLELLAKGRRYQEIADTTGLTLSTVRSHIMQAYQKLEVNSAVEAVHKARKLGLMGNEGP